MIKKLLLSLQFILLVIPVFAQDLEDFSFGVYFMAGGRYDDLRMCVASPAGVKGGPIADIMLDFRFRVDDATVIGVHLPVMRPLLFGFAFQMLQFEPEFFLEMYGQFSQTMYFTYGLGLGLSLHYGPDCHSDLDNRGESFFACGPLISAAAGIGFKGHLIKLHLWQLRVFYIPLFSVGRDTGTVLGGTVEYHLVF